MTERSECDSELMPCPFCGSTNVISSYRYKLGVCYSFVECRACRARGPEVKDRPYVSWNSHPITKLRAALEQILAISTDRERFVRMGPRGFAEAERIATEALAE